MPPSSEGILTLLSIRVSEREKEVITRAAEALSTTVSSFVLERAYERVQAVLAEQKHFRLSEKKMAGVLHGVGCAAERHSCIAEIADRAEHLR